MGMLHIPGVLTGEALARVQSRIGSASWSSGSKTAGHLSAKVKNNRQIEENDQIGLGAAALILDALAINPTFASAALASKISPPLFNRYDVGQTYGPHIDGAIRPLGAMRMRTDLSATLFLSAPESYEGGELVIRDSAAEQGIKLPAGDLILYPSGAIHHVAPVRDGTRIASFFWVQSLVRDSEKRSMLFDLDRTIQSLSNGGAGPETLLELTALYHNLLRLWTDC